MHSRGGGVAATGGIDKCRIRQETFRTNGPRLTECLELTFAGGRDAEQSQAEGRRMLQGNPCRGSFRASSIDFEIAMAAAALTNIKRYLAAQSADLQHRAEVDSRQNHLQLAIVDRTRRFGVGDDRGVQEISLIAQTMSVFHLATHCGIYRNQGSWNRERPLIEPWVAATRF